MKSDMILDALMAPALAVMGPIYKVSLWSIETIEPFLPLGKLNIYKIDE